MDHPNTGDAPEFTYEDLLAYARRWRENRLTEEDRAMLSSGVSQTAYRQIIAGREYLIPLPRNLRLLSLSPELARRLTRFP